MKTPNTPRGYFLPSTLAILALVALAPESKGEADTISVNFTGTNWNGNVPNSLGAGEVAGVAPAANWNNLDGASGGPASLINSNGAATGASAAWSASHTWSWERSWKAVPPSADGTMFNGYLDTNGNNGSISIDVSNVPYSKYDIIVYVDGEYNSGLYYSRPARFNVGGDDAWIRDTTNWNGTYVQGVGTDLASATRGANYVRFNGLSGSSSSITIYGEAETFRAAINGFQILGPVPVEIDIKPGSPENTVNLGSQGVTKVAILGSEDFDASQVDPLTVKLADATVKVKGKGQVMSKIQDTNGDGFLDLVLHMETNGFTLTDGDVSARLTGTTFGGEDIQGEDHVRVVP